MSAFHFAPNIIVGTGTGPVGWGSFDLNAYEKGTLAALEEIVKTSWVGYGLIMVIRELSGQIIITPNFSRVCNATAALPTWNSQNQVEIIYTPDVFGKVSCNGPGFHADEFLLHELIHAYRRLKNKNVNTVKLEVDGFRYDNVEEFASILYTNIYISAKNRGALRKDHLDNTPLASQYSTSRGFFIVKKHAMLVHNLICEDYHFCQTYARRDGGAFNPINYFLTHSAEVSGMIEWPKDMVADKPNP